MKATLLYVSAAMIVSPAWCQTFNPDPIVAQAATLLNKLDAATRAARESGETLPPDEAARIERLRACVQNLVDRKWPQAFEDAQWLADNDDFPPKVQIVLGTLQWFGLGTPRDPQAAARTLERAAGDGDTAAMEMLAGFYERGGALPQDLEQAFHWYQLAAVRGSKVAQSYLAKAYMSGIGVIKDTEKARWYAAVAAPPKTVPDSNSDVTRSILSRAGAELQPGIFAFNQGRYDRARTLLQPFADKNNLYAQAMIGMMYLEGSGAPKDAAKAIEYLKPAADSDNPLAQYLLASCYATGNGVPKDLTLARRYLVPAAETGWPVSQYTLAKIYQMQKLPDRAKTWLRAAADQGYVLSQVDLAAILFASSQVTDKIEAFRWSTRLAEESHNAQGALMTGNCLLEFGCAKRNPAEAARWLERAAMAGIAEAAYKLAGLYRSGQGVAKDPAQAAWWMKAAADQAYVPAENELGDLYRQGEGIARSNPEAAKWYLRAARKNHWDACGHLSVLYDENAIDPSLAGTASSRAAAYMFFELSARDGAVAPPARRTQLLGKMSPDEKRDAESALAAWEARYPSKKVWPVPVIGGLIAGLPGFAPPPPPPPLPVRTPATGGIPGGISGGGGGVGGGVYRMPPARLTIAENLQQAKLIDSATPLYPPAARQGGIAGAVHLHVVIAADGSVQSVEPVDGPPLLTAAATGAVRRWIYRPTLSNGQRAEVSTTVTVTFPLGGAVLPVLACDRPQTSDAGGKTLTLTVRNDASAERTIFAVDSQGQASDYGILLPGQYRQLQSASGQVWMFADRDKSCRAYVRVANEDGLAIVN